MSIPITEKLIQRQINNWHRFREFLHDEEPSTTVKPVITISRQAGSGGRALAVTLSERLGLEMQDRSLVERVVEDEELEHSLVADLDETAISQAELWVKGVLQQRIFLKDQYHLALAKVVMTLAARGGVVFLGRGAEWILGQNANLRVRVVASYRTRLANMIERTGLSRAETRVMLDDIDQQRDTFIRTVFRQEPGAPDHYDLVLNADRLQPECMLEIVSLALLERETSPQARLAGRA